MLRPAQTAIANEVVHIVDFQFRQNPCGPLRKAGDPFYGEHLRGQPAKHRCLIARSGSNLQDLLGSLQRQQLSHVGNDVGLRDRLLIANRQRTVIIS